MDGTGRVRVDFTSADHDSDTAPEDAMRTLVHMSDAQVEALDALARRLRRSRAALVRAAIDDYLERHRSEQVEEGFGLWGNREVDGLAYQESARREW